jgi:preprotein translocase subunit SecD
MEREWTWRGIGIALVALFFIYLLVPSYYYFKLPADVRNDKEQFDASLPSWVKKLPKALRPANHLNLGLDLQGGIHLVMEVDVDAALTAKVVNRSSDIPDYLQKKGIEGVKGRIVNKTEVELTAPAGKVGDVEKELAESYNDMERSGASGDVVNYRFKAEAVRQMKDGAVEQSIKAIRNRVDKFGVTEPTINRRGVNHILVQLPGFKDPEQAKELIGKTAQLEFRIVNDEDRSLSGLAKDLPPTITLVTSRGTPFLRGTDQKNLQDYLAKNLAEKGPPGFEFMIGHSDGERGHENEYRTYLVTDKPGITGEYLTDAKVQFSNEGVGNLPEVGFTFNKHGADLLGKLTGDNVGKGMAIILDGVIMSAPNIRSKIGEGSGRITLGSGKDVVKEAQNLALVLKAGALPAPVTIAEQRVVGASLGPELIHSGAIAVVVGTLLVILFMMLYYRMSGVVADVALMLNAILILGSLTLFGAALSLPGIAGIVLTLGVAVDANVIINERIREELRAGKTPRTALALGYERAFAAIFDSNLTTVISGVVLWQYGTGPIRGFAVTLVIGVIASMFTAIVVTRWMMDFLVAKRPERLSV